MKGPWCSSDVEVKVVLDERSRHELYLTLEQALGATEATTLMEHLPPVGWADVATKHDLKLELARVRQEIAAAKQEVLATLHRELSVQTRTFILAMIGLMVTFAGLTITATSLI